GVTGSGKTLVYMELIDRVLAEGRQVIVLIPEISLTWQTVLRFVKRFGSGVSFMHSRLTYGERYDQMKTASRGEVRIMVGPRSALFTPFPNLGLVIIDEEHEESYHSETVPRFHARETAIERARLEGAHVVLGSATPSVNSYFEMKQGHYKGVFLPERFGSQSLAETKIIDMREEIKAGNRSMFSEELQREMKTRLDKKEQIMLFLNRRGYSGSVTCRSCGTVMKCPHCDVALTLHGKKSLVCHYCGYETPAVRKCPDCGSPYIGGMSIGTEQLEEKVRELFPGAGVLRMDGDTTRGKDGHRKILTEFSSGDADILIGTQMIVKGHDFPHVTLVGVILADLSLNASDYTSAERTYQLLTQAAGRAGRGEKAGLALIQTYRPDHYSITTAAAQDYNQFYSFEIAYRTLLRYPPAAGMTAVLGSSENEELLHTAMTYLRKYIDRIDRSGRMMTVGPAPQSVSKIRDRYRDVIYFRSESEDNLILLKDRLEKYIAINPGFQDVQIQFDRI
ncbi:MAG: primosomal protein N', partial [Lachnospiraceae bacterium]|nr:primosomal protein N' [Lachnospiraceae bacterium]